VFQFLIYRLRGEMWNLSSYFRAGVSIVRPARGVPAGFWGGPVRAALADDVHPVRPVGARTATQPSVPRELQGNRTHSRQAVGLPSTTSSHNVSTAPGSDTICDPYAPPELPDYITLFSDDPDPQQLPPISRLEVSFG